MTLGGEDLKSPPAALDEMQRERARAPLQPDVRHRIADRDDVEVELCESERRFRETFENAAVALWRNDYSDVLDLLDGLRANGVSDVRAYFRGRPDRIIDAIGRIRVLDVNRRAVELYEAGGKQELLGALSAAVFSPETEAVFIEEMAVLWEGARRFQGEAVVQSLKGRRLEIVFSVAYEGERCERSLASVFDLSSQKAAERALLDQTRRLALINNVAKTIGSNLDLEAIVQIVTDAATEAAGAQFGAFFYSTANGEGKNYFLFKYSGAAREALEKLDPPRNIALFEPTFCGASLIRSDNIFEDPRYGAPREPDDAPDEASPIVSYLAAPIASRTGEVLGGIFLGHERAGAFDKAAEEILAGIAAHAAVAVDNARLFEAAQSEIAERRRAQGELKRLAAVVEFSEDAVVTEDLNGIITSWNAGAKRLFGYAADEVIGAPATLLIPPGRHDEEPDTLRRIRSGVRVEPFETVRQRKGGRPVEISLGVSPIRNEEGEVIGASMIARDFTELRKAQKQQALLIEEMKHRVKNSLATVQSIAAQTFRRASLEERAAFNARLHALAKAHDLLTRKTWTQAPMKEVVGRALEPFRESAGRRIAFQGPDLSIEAGKVLPLAMALHELGTNAAKYGALSNESGRVGVHWQIGGKADRLCVRLIWREEGGPPVRRPIRKGFGTFLIESVMDSAGETVLSFEPSGVVCRMDVAL
jgi:PAS domain S-box-containing protein